MAKYRVVIAMSAYFVYRVEGKDDQDAYDKAAHLHETDRDSAWFVEPEGSWDVIEIHDEEEDCCCEMCGHFYKGDGNSDNGYDCPKCGHNEVGEDG
jgi:hypothetical protein